MRRRDYENGDHSPADVTHTTQLLKETWARVADGYHALEGKLHCLPPRDRIAIVIALEQQGQSLLQAMRVLAETRYYLHMRGNRRKKTPRLIEDNFTDAIAEIISKASSAGFARQRKIRKR